jgi:hypothetical protein
VWQLLLSLSLNNEGGSNIFGIDSEIDMNTHRIREQNIPKRQERTQTKSYNYKQHNKLLSAPVFPLFFQHLGFSEFLDVLSFGN